MFGHFVRVHRRRLGLTQEELADRTGVSVRSISKIETGRVGAPRPTTVRLLADAFGLSGDDRNRFCAAAMPASAATSSAPGMDASLSNVPRHLPPGLPTFAGRDVELGEFRRLLTADRLSRQPVIIACCGVAGVGKSTVAVKAAHEAAVLFSDGQLYVDLHGSSPGLAPLEPVEVLGRLLRALGVQPAQVPTECDEAAGALRSMLATRRVLILADNAAGAAQVRPLVPASPGSALLVTSRPMLAALDGARHIALDVMSPDESVAVLGGLCGHDRIAAEADRAATLAHLCDHLPLALKIAGARLAGRPGWRVGALVEQLEDKRRRLDELAFGDLAVRSSFETAYRDMQRACPTAARLFRLISVVTVRALTLRVAADLLHLPDGQAGSALARLAESRLIEPSGSNSYLVHDLLRLFAADRALAEESTGDREAALTRVLDRYLSTLRRASDLTRPLPRRQTHTDDGRVEPIPLADRAQAMAWFESEHANLNALVAQAVDMARPEAPFFARFALAVERELHTFLTMNGYRRDMENLAELASNAAERIGDLTARAYSLAGLAYAQLTNGKRAKALATATRSLAFARAAKDPSEEANSLGVLAYIHYAQGDAGLALTSLDQAVTLRHESGNLVGEGIAVHNMAEVLVSLSRLTEAQELLQRCLAIRRSIPDRIGEVFTLSSLGRLQLMTRNLGAAETTLRQALDGCRETGHRDEEWRVLVGLSVIDARKGNAQRALARAEVALRVANKADSASGQVLALKASAKALRLLGRGKQAIAHTRRAEQIISDVDPPADKEIAALLNV